MAVKPEHLTTDLLPKVLGRSWEAKETEEVARVNVSIGLGLGEAQANAFTNLESKIEDLRLENQKLRRALVEVASVKAEMASMKAALAQLAGDQTGREVVRSAAVSGNKASE